MSSTRKLYPNWYLIGILIGIAACAVFMVTQIHVPGGASAHPVDSYGPACGAATVDGSIGQQEWAAAAKRTFLMVAPNIGEPFNATLYVMNSGHYLYIGVTINDDDLSSYGEYLPQGDETYFTFDNDHSGTLYTVNDDGLSVYAGPPQFGDRFIIGDLQNPAYAPLDREYGSPSDGLGYPGRMGGLNHFELRHPLCSGDKRDFCLHAGDTVGFQLEYLDANADHSFGGTQFYPTNGDTAMADIVIGTCSAVDLFTYLPLLRK